MEQAKPEQVGLSSQRLARIDRLLARYVESGRLAGVVALVYRRGKVAYCQTFGQRDRETDRPMELDTIFRIYSMTKPITAVAALMLHEQGCYLLDDPVAQYIPAFAETQVYAGAGMTGPILEKPERPITIKDLFCHTAGLSYGFFKDSPVEELYRQTFDARHELPLAQAVEKLAALPLLFHPGTAWRYSYASDVLGRLVEVLSGVSLDEFFRQEIFEPLGMSDTAFSVPEEAVDRFAACYSPPGGFHFGTSLTESPPAEGPIEVLDAPTTSRFVRPPVFLSGGSGLVSTATDYLRWAQMLLNGGVLDGNRLLGRKTVELMTMNHLPPHLIPIVLGGDPIAGYGFGLGVSVLVDVAAAAAPGSPGAYGWGGAAMTQFWIDPQEDLIGLFLTQFMPSSHYPIRRQFRVAVYQALVD